MSNRTEVLKKSYNLEKHPEGGWFVEHYTAPFEKDGRPLAGSIYFLLDKGEISHFHQIDCDEIWYFHEGCGMKVVMLTEEKGKEEFLLGNDVENGQTAMVLIPKGAIFGAENLKPDGFTFISCATTPNFTYEGFRLVNKQEIKEKFPKYAEELEYMAY
ncbi:hypothetical protein BCR32DRAFT_92474 [Anaeromyces robustus]|uniref:DUF985 domain-containing protein n=1 Tax=Anaeromyces robustus TaxID=1754192 RepID=A0A1Y1WQB9_9FUNG|nr:hypothetical protein BCR32DRAFT_92474 [Anaeromyces robustus]|eukprot:ORX75456.1 hypothetical protein BCR32DRAFT_92474 [Anaeromyces robustus]